MSSFPLNLKGIECIFNQFSSPILDLSKYSRIFVPKISIFMINNELINPKSIVVIGGSNNT
ncbi:MAG: hypothetical protein LBE91_15725, partial [Tannerella sp.]|nr:hypothetical protein [Tannerella sp.]